MRAIALVSKVDESSRRNGNRGATLPGRGREPGAQSGTSVAPRLALASGFEGFGAGP
jgi:hypothetical protein